MTREEAIKELAVHLVHWKRLKNEHIVPTDECESTINALRMAIEALKADAVQEAVPTVVRVTMSDGNQYYLEHERDECDHCVYKWDTKGGDTE